MDSVMKNKILFALLTPVFSISCSSLPELSYKSKTRDTSDSALISTSIREKCFFNIIKKREKINDKVSQECQKKVFYPIDEEQSQVIAVLEINEQGRFVNQQHVSAVLNTIEESKNPFVNLFIHGWKHNGEIDDTNLISFKEILLRLNVKKKLADKKRTNIGIYIAWRGKTTQLPAIKELTFWSRKNISENIGTGDLAHFILELEQTLNLKKTSTSEKTNLILTGHSFGASALYHALGPILVSRFNHSLTNQNLDKTTSLQGIGDLILLINPAIEAKKFLPLREAIWRKAAQEKTLNPTIFRNNYRPFFVVLGSNADSPINNYFPIGRWFGTQTQKYDTTEILDGNGMPQSTQQLHPSMKKYCDSHSSENDNLNYCITHENKLDRHAIGNFPPFYTHWLSKDAYLTNNTMTPHKSACSLSPEYFSSNASDDLKYYREQTLIHFNQKNFLVLSNYMIKDQAHRWKKYGINFREEPNITTKSLATSWPQNPYWFVRVNEKVLSSHTKIWDNELGCFLLSLIDV